MHCRERRQIGRPSFAGKGKCTNRWHPKKQEQKSTRRSGHSLGQRDLSRPLAVEGEEHDAFKEDQAETDSVISRLLEECMVQEAFRCELPFCIPAVQRMH